MLALLASACSPASPCERYCEVFGACRTAGEAEVDACTFQCEADIARGELTEDVVDRCGRCAEDVSCSNLSLCGGSSGPCGGL